MPCARSNSSSNGTSVVCALLAKKSWRNVGITQISHFGCSISNLNLKIRVWTLIGWRNATGGSLAFAQLPDQFILEIFFGLDHFAHFRRRQYLQKLCCVVFADVEQVALIFQIILYLL